MEMRDHLSPELAATVSRFLGINRTFNGYLVVVILNVCSRSSLTHPGDPDVRGVALGVSG